MTVRPVEDVDGRSADWSDAVTVVSIVGALSSSSICRIRHLVSTLARIGSERRSRSCS